MNKQHDQLDHLLRQWDEQRQPGQDKLNALQERILTALQKATAENEAATRPEPVAANGWRTLAVRLAVVAALLFLAVGLWCMQPRRVIPEMPGETPAFVRLESQQLADHAILLSEMEQVFDDQLWWVAESGGEVRMGLEPDAASMGEQPLAIRVVLVQRERNRLGWKNVWTVDVVSRSQRVVRLDPVAGDGVRMTLWAYILPDGMVAIDSDFSSEGSVRFHATSNSLQQPGEAKQVFSQRDDSAEYRVYQTVSLLDEA